MNNYERRNVVLSIVVVASFLLGWSWLGYLRPALLESPQNPVEQRISIVSGTALKQIPLKQIQVTTTADVGAGSLRWAVGQANAAPDDDLIDLSRVEGAIALQSPLPALKSNLILAGNGNITISGSHHHRVFQIDDGDITFRDLTIADGLAQGRAGVNGSGGSAGMGGGLLINQGVVRLVRVTFLNNQAIGGSGSQRSPVQVRIRDQEYRIRSIEEQ